MANEWDDTDGTADDGSWVSKLRKQNKELKAQNEDALSRLAALEAKSSYRDINRAFASRGIDPRFSKFYAGDGSDESIDNWVTENDELLGLAKPASEASEDSVVSASDQEAWGMLREMATERKQITDVHSRLMEAQNKEEIMAIVDEIKGLGSNSF